MNNIVKQLWIDALRSGKYKQGRNCLRSYVSNRFCCLGVLCDIHSLETGGAWKPTPVTDDFDYLGQTAVLPGEVCKWAGPDVSGNPMLGDSVATRHNDSGKSFTEIADLIEKHL